MNDARKVCFVVMGFGKKTDYETGRTLDLDATYEAIIEPAATAQGLRCIRSDEIMHSGVIDNEMFEMLLRAELVIADISTGNVNAVYELGVRHALRPNATIIMKEAEGRIHFDLSHVNTFHYEHLGADIGSREKARATRELELLVQSSLAAARPDSPVYTHLPRLQGPRLSDDQYEDLLQETEDKQERLSDLLQAGDKAAKESRHIDAADAYRSALVMKPGEPFLIQQLALATYKSATPSVLSSLIQALQIIDDLNPSDSNDPETLGISGAIYKRLWLAAKDSFHLDSAIRHYRRGFEVRRDYYNGENLAHCYELKADSESDALEAQFYRVSARKVRQEISERLRKIVASPDFSERSDQRWIYATLANISLVDGPAGDAEQYEELFLSCEPAQWEVDTYVETKRRVQTGTNT